MTAEPTAAVERRAVAVALTGLVLQCLLVGFVFVLARWTGSWGLEAAVRHAAGAVGIWLALLLIAHQQKLVKLEALELEALKRERQAGGRSAEAIFRGEEETLLLARRRLDLMVKVLMPLVTVLLAAYHLAAAWWGWPWAWGTSLSAPVWPQMRNMLPAGAFLVGAAFVCFLYSRYVAGLARLSDAKILRAGSSYLFSNAVILAALGISLGVADQFHRPGFEHAMAYVVRGLLVVLGMEFILNFGLDFYRPRTPGEIPRPGFDSRFLGLFSETEGIARSIAEAINYQFGFEVSSTWFYKLMQRAIVPLIGFGVVCLVVMSCFVVVEPHEQAVIERLGRPLQEREPLGPGLHLKYPWPIDVAYKFPVHRIQEVVLGFTEKPVAGFEEEDERIVLWTREKHGPREEADLLVATPPTEFERQLEALRAELGEEWVARSVPVSLVRGVVSVQYRIRNLYRYGYAYENPRDLIEGFAYRELIRYAASADLDYLLGAGREAASQTLRQRIQQRADELDLGIEVTYVGLVNIHPPPKVAEAFQEVVGAMQEREAAIEEALAKRNLVLASVTGDVELSRRLAEYIRRADALARDPHADPAEVERLRRLRDETFAQAKGEVSRLLAEARAQRWSLEMAARSQMVAFENELQAYRAAPRLYAWRKYLGVMQEGLEPVRKYLLGMDPGGRKVTVIFDMKEEETFASELAKPPGSEESP